MCIFDVFRLRDEIKRLKKSLIQDLFPLRYIITGNKYKDGQHLYSYFTCPLLLSSYNVFIYLFIFATLICLFKLFITNCCFFPICTYFLSYLFTVIMYRKGKRSWIRLFLVFWSHPWACKHQRYTMVDGPNVHCS